MVNPQGPPKIVGNCFGCDKPFWDAETVDGLCAACRDEATARDRIEAIERELATEREENEKLRYVVRAEIKRRVTELQAAEKELATERERRQAAEMDHAKLLRKVQALALEADHQEERADVAEKKLAKARDDLHRVLPSLTHIKNDCETMSGFIRRSFAATEPEERDDA